MRVRDGKKRGKRGRARGHARDRHNAAGASSHTTHLEIRSSAARGPPQHVQHGAAAPYQEGASRLWVCQGVPLLAWHRALQLPRRGVCTWCDISSMRVRNRQLARQRRAQDSRAIREHCRTFQPHRARCSSAPKRHATRAREHRAPGPIRAEGSNTRAREEAQTQRPALPAWGPHAVRPAHATQHPARGPRRTTDHVSLGVLLSSQGDVKSL